MLITILGGIIVLLVAGFISWPLLGANDSSRAASPEDFQTQEDFLVLEKRRDNALSSLRDAEMDHETGRLSEADYASMRSELETEAMAAIAELDQMGGGSGLKYAASTIIYLSKKKEKDGKEVIGNIIKAKTHKSRLSKENKTVDIRLYYDSRGLDRYYGLLELGEIGGLWKNVAGRYEMNGKKIYAKQILAEPETYFTDEVMQALDEIAQKEFSYGEN